MLSHTYNQAYINNSTMVAISALSLITELKEKQVGDNNIILAVHAHIRDEIRKGCFQAFKGGFDKFGTAQLFSLGADQHGVRIWRMGNRVNITHMRPGGYEKKSKELKFLIGALTELALADEKHVSVVVPKSVKLESSKAA